MNVHKDFLSKDLITELNTGFVFLEDNAHFPWIILVYKRDVPNMLSLSTEERLELMRDIETCEKVISKLYSPFQINIASFGNKTRWLHVHIISRKEDDICFPLPPFNVNPTKYDLNKKDEEMKKLKNAFLIHI